jgi:triosephosphate isomerase (TIM)
MRKLAAANWKMNGLRADGIALVEQILERAAREPPACDVVICPPATLLHSLATLLARSTIGLGAQNCHAAPKGAHTGELSAAMLRDAGCGHVILGHSERRNDQGETDAMVRAKVSAARAAGLVPIVCVGESLAQREAGETLAVVARQLQASLPSGLSAAELVIAYEPVWAIGSGRTPTAAQIAEVHAHIRERLAAGVSNPAKMRILYGGSVKAANAEELMSVANVDGALVGGASLAADEFWAIARACAEV